MNGTRKPSSPSAGALIRSGIAILLLACPLLARPTARFQKSEYSLTLVLQLAKPFSIEDMNDDYQSARILHQDQDSAIVEVVHHPLAKPAPIRENAHWKRDDAGMTRYLRPTPSENWDAQMQRDLLAELQQAGIDPNRLTDLQLVTQVSRWAKERSTFVRPFTTFFVHFPKGVPEVYGPLRKAFDQEKPSPETTDQVMFENEVLGKQMFYGRKHGACTSYAVYQATILRALGIPTRIVVCVPPADANEGAQKELLLKSIRHNAVRATIRHGLSRTGSREHGTFSDHMFNEVYVGRRWVRLNYEALGQAPLDPHYLGLMTHILTASSLSEIPLAQTWGARYAELPQAAPPLSSANPYRLLAVREHLDPGAANPEAEDEHKAVHVIQAFWRDALPEFVEAAAMDPRTDFFLGIQEYIPDYTYQLSDFMGHASQGFLLTAPGHPDLHARWSGRTMNSGSTGHRYALFGMGIEKADRALFVPGQDYAVQPLENRAVYTWTVDPALRIQGTLPEQVVIKEMTVIGAYWQGAIPVEGINRMFQERDKVADFVIRLRAPEPCTSEQIGQFCKSNQPRFILSAPGQPDLQASLTHTISTWNSLQDGNWPVVGLVLDQKCRAMMAAGVEYSLRPVSTSEKQKWEVAAGIRLKGRELKP